MATLLWMQAGSCSGDTMSLLCADDPDLPRFLALNGIDLLWQPSLTAEPVSVLHRRVDAILGGTLELDILCVEGSIVTGPAGSGLFDRYRRGEGKHRVIEALAGRARHVVAMGTCAAFGGVHAAPPNPTDCVGLQFSGERPGGLLPAQWRARGGLPVVNVAGCPAHPLAMTGTLAFLAAGLPLALDAINRPRQWFDVPVHSGCSRNEYHEYDVEDTELGGDACLFFNLGCKGPVTRAVCNTELWNRRSSKTRVGVPCFGCTGPGFPADGNLFVTEKLGTVPLKLPEGVDRPKYMAYKQLAKQAMPGRLREGKGGR
jgi:NiFe hydrogenase small subunit HydA